MAPLKSPRREAFAQNVAKSPKTGKTLGPCYIEAGYKARGHSAESLGSQLLKNAEVKQRIDEIMRPALKKARVSVESILAELETTIQDARAAKQHSVVVNALTLSAKLVGLLRDRIEVGGPGDFGELTTEKVIDDMITQLGGGDAAMALASFDELIAGVRATMEERAARHATIIEPSRSSEAALGLAMLRPTPKGGRSRHS